ncbi:diguanylate cyclase domain-containing protein [Thalassotalea maritima]|uniref:diguanylate cyclase domain-containing protein n=1 Tax=Thalassotalea maritima TaxID=3242416 RepID=UPI00352970D9
MAKITLVVVLILLMSPWLVRSAPQEKDLYVVAYCNNVYPFQYHRDGEATGVLIDLWQLWAKKQNVRIKFVGYDNAKCVPAVDEPMIDFHAGLLATNDQGVKYHKSQPLLKNQNYFYIPVDAAHLSNVSHLQPYVIGVVGDNAVERMLKNRYPNVVIKRFRSIDKLYDAAITGAIRVFADTAEGYRRYARFQQLRTLYPSANRILLGENELFAAVKTENKQLLDFINQGLAKLSEQEKDWLGFRHIKKEFGDDSLLVGYSPDLSPFMSQGEKGRAQGLFIDMWRRWADKQQLILEFVPVKQTSIEKAFESGIIDVHAGLPLSQQSKQRYRELWPIYRSQARFFAHKDNLQIDDFSKVNRASVGVITDSAYAEAVQQNYPNLLISERYLIANLVSDSVDGKTIGFIASEEAGREYLSRANLTSSFTVRGMPKFDASYLSFTANNRANHHPLLQGKQMLTEQETQQVIECWFTLQHSQQQTEYFVNLTDKEMSLIARKQRFNVGTISHWKPFSFVNSQGQVAGVNQDILHALHRLTSIDFNLMVYPNWQTMRQAFATDELDVMMTMTAKPKGDSIPLTTKNYWPSRWGVIHTLDNLNSDSVDALHGYKVGIFAHRNTIEYLRENHPSIELTVVNDTTEANRLLKSQQIDAYIDYFLVVSALLEELESRQTAVAYLHNLPNEQNVMAINSRYPELVGIFDKAIDKLSEEEIDNIRDSWVRTVIQEGLDAKVVYRTSILVGALGVTVLLSILFWTYRMRREIAKRKALERQLRFAATHDHLTKLASRNLLEQLLEQTIAVHRRYQRMFAVLFIDIDGFKPVNDSYGHDAGDKLLIEIANILRHTVRSSDLVARVGGDEFVIVVNDIGNIDTAKNMAQKVIEALADKVLIDALKIHIGASIGIAVYPTDGDDRRELLKVADSRMYRAKASGKNNYYLAAKNV